MRVTLIRHTSVAVPRGTCYGWSDVPVADSFEIEASITKERLQGMTFDHVYSSTLTRAMKLAEWCCFHNATIDDRLKEMNMGEWEMQRYDDIHDPALQRWYDDFLHLPATGGESFPMLRQRVGSFLDELSQKNYRHVAVFAHGGVIVAACLYVGLYPEEEAFSHQLGYGEVMDIEI
ncbi:MAG: alpha-ribazole phosphatase [Prevotella sp.]|nr:alpha-ribazole phosphatase [Prevotella sp.]